MSRRLRWSLCGMLFAVGGVLACSEPGTEDLTAPDPAATLSAGTIDGPTNVSVFEFATYTSSLYPRLEPDPSGCLLIASNEDYELSGMWLHACEAGSAPYTAYIRAYDSSGVLRASLRVTVSP